MQLPFNSDTAKLFPNYWAEGYGQPHVASVTQFNPPDRSLLDIEFLEDVGCDCYHMIGWVGPREQLNDFATAVTQGLNGYLEKMSPAAIGAGDAVIVALWDSPSNKFAYCMIVTYVGQGELDDSFEDIATPFKRKGWPNIVACASSGNDWNMPAQIHAIKESFDEKEPAYQDAQRAVLVSAATESVDQIVQLKNTRYAWTVV